MAEIISLKNKLEVSRTKRACEEYKKKIQAMDKLELLEEMVRFYEDWNIIDVPALEMIIKGMIFFEILKDKCETEELKHSTEFYYGLLELELKNYERANESRISSN